MSFSLKLLSGHFYGQSFIKTVRGPLKACMYFVCNCIKFKESVLNHFQNLENGGKGTIQDSFFSHNGVRPYQVYTVVTSILSLSVLIFKILTVNDLMLLHMSKKLVILPSCPKVAFDHL